MAIHRKAGILFCGLLICSLNWGCGAKTVAGQKTTTKVRGRVTVDGDVPKSPVTIICHAKDAAQEDDIKPSAKTREDGSFEFISYKSGDGVPEGEYVLTFTQNAFDPMKRKSKGPDLLNNRYNSVKDSGFEFKVEKKTLDLGTLELISK
jgi:hypothetical protein